MKNQWLLSVIAALAVGCSPAENTTMGESQPAQVASAAEASGSEYLELPVVSLISMESGKP